MEGMRQILGVGNGLIVFCNRNEMQKTYLLALLVLLLQHKIYV